MRIYRNFKESNSITLFNGDCRKLLKRLPDESVDLVVTSPPYCIGKAYEDPHDDIETFRKQHQDIFSDGWTIDFSKDGFKYTSSQYRKFSTQILREAFQVSDEIIATI